MPISPDAGTYVNSVPNEWEVTPAGNYSIATDTSSLSQFASTIDFGAYTPRVVSGGPDGGPDTYIWMFNVHTNKGVANDDVSTNSYMSAITNVTESDCEIQRGWH